MDTIMSLHGVLQGAFGKGLGLLALGIELFVLLGYFASPLYVSLISLLVFFWLCGLPVWFCLVFVVLGFIFALPPLRALLFSAPVMGFIKLKKLMPTISETEQVALDAGSLWVDKELFSGKPDFKKIMKEPYGRLNETEQSFIDVQCEQLCQMVDDIKAYKHGDLPPEAWDFIKKERFLGLIIPKEYGGLGFSALAHSEIISKLATRSMPLVVTVMVPNSLGPAELLIHYGTQTQRDLYLPRLATGEEIPCFGLTELHAGSDAGALQANGKVFKGEDGKLYLRLNWQKRYITLGAVSTLVGLAVRLFDPEHLLGKNEDLGITCVLVPSQTAGVVLGYRHDPLGVPFYNCPIEGHDVVVSVEQIIGGVAGAGQGWKMLMECLAAGRAISLPSSSAGVAKKLTRVTGAYAKVRQQFGVSIGSFEGIEELLAYMGGMSYVLEASRIFTVGAVDNHLKPAVVSAITKYQSTELARDLVIHAMDIWGGAGISLGERNLVAKYYISAPIPITVEGANILTRSMIIFGQGALRCHPYAHKEVKAVETGDVSAFDQAFFGHLGHVISNFCRLFVISLTRASLVQTKSESSLAVYFRKMTWASTSFAVLTELSMLLLGGQLKFKEKITGRFADILSWMYLVTAALRRFEAEGSKKEHELFVHYVAQHGLFKIHEAFQGIVNNFSDNRFIGGFFKYVVGTWGRLNQIQKAPSDQLGHEMAQVLMKKGDLRDLLTLQATYIPKEEGDAFHRLEKALGMSKEVEELNRKISLAVREKRLPKGRPPQLVKQALEKGLINEEEANLFENYKALYTEAMKVDSYKLEDYKAARRMG
ncbi:MAG: acyl-CoA dehydrogenase [Oligoflexales bacterium]|nr:acyl-CoA dehydrogenase [Oligoflexales bacterium]